MKRLQIPLAWLSSFALIGSNVLLEGCGAKESTPAPVVQQAAANSADGTAQQAQPAAQQAGDPAGAAPAADQNAPTALPEVNLTPDGLDDLMAPIALYPDPVLAVMMQAAVDPQEVMDGGNWLALDANQNLKEAALDQASSKAGFTPVMQALLHYPTVIDLMCTQFDWTKQLGAAYQANPKAVLASVQRLRAQAVDNGALKSSPQMNVDVTQQNGQQVVELKPPPNSQTVYIPQYNPDQVFQTTTTTTRPDGTTTTTTTTSGPAPTASTSTNSTTVVKEKEGVSTGTAVLIGLLSFGAGIAVGAAINNNNYYYPAWGYGGVYYGPRPYYPQPYRPVYYGGYHGGGYYNRPAHYGNNNIYINNNNNYYNRFNNNNNLNPNYKPRPVPYNRAPNSTYSKNMGSRPGANQGVNYRPPNNAKVGARPATGNIQQRPGQAPGQTPGQRPAAGNNASNWKGQSTYQGNKAVNSGNRPTTMPANGGAGANNRVGTGNAGTRNPSADRGFAQNNGARPNTGNANASRPNTGDANARPSAGNQPANRPAGGNQPAARPQPTSRPATQQSRPQQNEGAFGGANNAKSDRAASSRGKASMGASSGHSAQPRSGGGRKH
jgi:Protein of unknown function (DUF3300)